MYTCLHYNFFASFLILDDDKIVASGFYAANLWNSFDFARYNISYNTSSKNLEVSSKDRTIQSSDDFQIRCTSPSLSLSILFYFIIIIYMYLFIYFYFL